MGDIGIEFISIALCASQLKDDVGHIYKRENRTIIGDPCFDPLKGWEGWSGGPAKGQVMLIATRSKEARAEFSRKMAIHHAVELNQTFVVFSEEKFFRYLKKLVDDLAEVSTETAIYDGSLDAGELRRVRGALAYLIQASLYIGASRSSNLEAACAETNGLIKGRGKEGAVLVDNIRGFIDGQRTMLEPEAVLVRLRTMAQEFNVPVIALYPLQADEDHPHTLTRQELNEIERLARCADSTLLLAKGRNVLMFLRPKLPVAG